MKNKSTRLFTLIIVLCGMVSVGSNLSLTKGHYRTTNSLNWSNSHESHNRMTKNKHSLKRNKLLKIEPFYKYSIAGGPALNLEWNKKTNCMRQKLKKHFVYHSSYKAKLISNQSIPFSAAGFSNEPRNKHHHDNLKTYTYGLAMLALFGGGALVALCIVYVAKLLNEKETSSPGLQENFK